MTAINVISTSNAADLGYRALADVAAASEGILLADYRIVVAIWSNCSFMRIPPRRQLSEARPTPMQESGAVAVGQNRRHQLVERGYKALRATTTFARMRMPPVSGLIC